MKVRAKQDVYINGYREKGAVFEYEGPPDTNLQRVHNDVPAGPPPAPLKAKGDVRADVKRDDAPQEDLFG